MVLNPDLLSSFLSKGGPFSKSFTQFKQREEQLEMLHAIIQGINEEKIALIEAGTGVGKSLAYLLPVLYLSQETGQKIVISTHTITLQEQLLQKDIPLILKTLNLDIKAVLVKGMNNYLCLRKLYDLLDQPSLQNPSQREELLHIEQWSKVTLEGSLSDLPSLPKAIAWNQLSCESDACSFVKCPFYKQCHFFKARKQAKDAKLLIVNHYLLLTDLKNQIEDAFNESILMNYQHLILDEAHTFEDIATKALARSIASQVIHRKLDSLVSGNKTLGKLQFLQKKLSSFEHELDPKLWQKISRDLYADKKELQELAHQAFLILSDFLDSKPPPNKAPSYPIDKITLTSEIREYEAWKVLKHNFEYFAQKSFSFSERLSLLVAELEKIKHPEIKKLIQNLLIDISAIALYLKKMGSTLDYFFNPKEYKDKIFVIEWKGGDSYSSIELLIIDLNIGDLLVEHLFNPRDASILCSATLSHNQQFDFIKENLGLSSLKCEQKQFIEKNLSSPFDYYNQVLLAIPSDMPEPNSSEYLSGLCQHILTAITTSNGGAFILFTSYKTLEHCYQTLLPRLLHLNLLPLKQGEERRTHLLESFKQSPRAVLFGTETFWEGVDVPGFHLRLVIITKLPFPVPFEPLFEAKCKQLELSGKNPFLSYSVPKAIIKFKQGFGRLIRNHQDFGSIVCLDSRILSKSYGRIFLKSIPVCKQVFGPKKKISQAMSDFYQKWSVTESNR